MHCILHELFMKFIADFILQGKFLTEKGNYFTCCIQEWFSFNSAILRNWQKPVCCLGKEGHNFFPTCSILGAGEGCRLLLARVGWWQKKTGCFCFYPQNIRIAYTVVSKIFKYGENLKLWKQYRIFVSYLTFLHLYVSLTSPPLRKFCHVIHKDREIMISGKCFVPFIF